MISSTASVDGWLIAARTQLGSALSGTLPNDQSTAEVFAAVDTYTEGMPTRIVTGGVGVLLGNSMRERMLLFADQRDDLRLLLMREPRGHAAMCGAILQPSTTPTAHIGVLFVTSSGHLEMCGHASIGLASALVATAVVQPQEPDTPVVLDTPAGVVHVSVRVSDGRVGAATIRNPAAYVLATGLTARAPFGRFGYDLGVCGGIYAIVDAAELGIHLADRDFAALGAAGSQIMEVIGQHHLNGELVACEHVVFVGPEEADGALLTATAHLGFVDRSPCGTGTSALLSVLHARGELQLGESVTVRSLSSGAFTARLEHTEADGERELAHTSITGRAWITGVGTFVLQDDDPLRAGFDW